MFDTYLDKCVHTHRESGPLQGKICVPRTDLHQERRDTERKRRGEFSTSFLPSSSDNRVGWPHSNFSGRCCCFCFLRRCWMCCCVALSPSQKQLIPVGGPRCRLYTHVCVCCFCCMLYINFRPMSFSLSLYPLAVHFFFFFPALQVSFSIP